MSGNGGSNDSDDICSSLTDLFISNGRNIADSSSSATYIDSSCEINCGVSDCHLYKSRSYKKDNDAIFSSVPNNICLSCPYKNETDKMNESNMPPLSESIGNINCDINLYPSLPISTSYDYLIPLPKESYEIDDIPEEIHSQQVFNTKQPSVIVEQNRYDIKTIYPTSSIPQQQQQQPSSQQVINSKGEEYSFTKIYEQQSDIIPRTPQIYAYTYNNQPSPFSQPSPLMNKSNLTPRSLTEIPLPDSYEDINLSDYNLDGNIFTKEEVYEYIKQSKEVVECNICKTIIKKIYSFGKPSENLYVCLECSNYLKDVKEYDWEESIKGKSSDKGKIINSITTPNIRFKRCSRKAHLKPIYSFLERDKQKGKNKNDVCKNEYALKGEKQCLYCRNFKKRFTMKKIMK